MFTQWVEAAAARIAIWHAGSIYRRFTRQLADVRQAQSEALHRALRVTAGSDFARQHALDRVRCPDDLRRAVPLMTYEDLAPVIDRVADGDVAAVFRRGQKILMFAASSGTTSRRKLIPVTPEFARDYKRGWNIFGVKLLTDFRGAVLKNILQGSGRMDEGRTASGVPFGAITGLLARHQKRIVRRLYVGRPEVAYLPDPRSRYYTLMRLGIEKRVGFAVTANPATLIRMAEIANEESERLIRDVRDGVLDSHLAPDAAINRTLAAPLRPQPERASELERLRAAHGRLRPADYWRIYFIACWTGGSMGHYLRRLSDWWGPCPVRDIGLLASEGRVTIPFADDTPSGVLDPTSGVFEFIPEREADATAPATLAPHELELGENYLVVVTNTSGLVRYRLDDVVRVTGWRGSTPELAFLHRAGRVASVAGEKLTEHHVMEAMRDACDRTHQTEFEFTLAPVWAEPPYYRVSAPIFLGETFLRVLDDALQAQNDEYGSRRKSLRLGPLRSRQAPASCFAAMLARLRAARGGAAEQFKRPYLLTTPGADDSALGLAGALTASLETSLIP